MVAIFYKTAAKGMVQQLPENTNIGPNPRSLADQQHDKTRRPRIIVKKRRR